MVTFFGALALTALAALLHLTGDQRPMVPWIGAALVLYLFVVVITIGINVPRNNEIKAAGDVDRMTDHAWCARAIRRGQVGPVESRTDVCLYPRLRPPRLGARRVWPTLLMQTRLGARWTTQ